MFFVFPLSAEGTALLSNSRGNASDEGYITYRVSGSHCIRSFGCPQNWHIVLFRIDVICPTAPENITGIPSCSTQGHGCATCIADVIYWYFFYAGTSPHCISNIVVRWHAFGRWLSTMSRMSGATGTRPSRYRCVPPPPLPLIAVNIAYIYVKYTAVGAV